MFRRSCVHPKHKSARSYTAAVPPEHKSACSYTAAVPPEHMSTRSYTAAVPPEHMLVVMSIPMHITPLVPCCGAH